MTIQEKLEEQYMNLSKRCLADEELSLLLEYINTDECVRVSHEDDDGKVECIGECSLDDLKSLIEDMQEFVKMLETKINE